MVDFSGDLFLGVVFWGEGRNTEFSAIRSIHKKLCPFLINNAENSSTIINIWQIGLPRLTGMGQLKWRNENDSLVKEKTKWEGRPLEGPAKPAL